MISKVMINMFGKKCLNKVLGLIIILLIPIYGVATVHALLWKISGNGLEQSSYLFGTMHSKDKRILNIDERVINHFDNCELFAMEVKMDESVYSEIFSLILAEENYRLSDYISEEEYGKIEKWFKENYGMKLDYFERIKPIFLYFMITQQGMGADKPFLDQHLYNLAVKKDIEIVGIESIEEQINALDILTLEQQIQLLVESVEKKQKEDRQLEKLTKLYLKGQLDKMLKIITKYSLNDAFFESLITKRNKIMAERIDGYVKGKATFVAIGAGHLPGEEGVINLLRRQGYTVEPVYLL